MTWDILGKSGRGERPTQQGDGTTAQEKYRTAFQQCTFLWNSLPEACPVLEPDPPTSSKESVWAAKLEHGVVCSYYDLFLRCCIKFALANDGAMPTDECFPCEYDCDCADISIGYTTQQMAVDEEQNLTVVGAVAGCTYTWAIGSGGGELSAATGTSTIYTAPSTNAGCANNPTITLSVEGSQCDSLGVAINTYAGAEIAVTKCTDRICPNPCDFLYDKCGSCWRHFYCSGGDVSAFLSFGCECMGDPGVRSPFDATCAEGIYNFGYNDRRTEAMITAGCCPEQLL